MRETLTFLRAFGRSAGSVGSLIPTSRAAARAMASEMARRSGPRRVLEVGPGTGAITAEIVRQLRPGDALVLVELEPALADYLARRIETEPAFRAHRDRITLHRGNVLELEDGAPFDFIISAIPFVNLPAEAVARILALYRARLAPGGVLSFIEYAFLRRLRLRLLSATGRARAEAALALMAESVEPFVFRRDFVAANLPPAWVRHLRFGPTEPAQALALAPTTHDHRLGLGARAGVSSLALPFVAGALGLGIALRRLPGAAPVSLLAAGALGLFFRDPVRAVRPDPALVYAAADGRVLSVERLRDAALGPGEWWRIATFLSLADVHVNRSPVAGQVVAVFDRAGGFANAAFPEAEANASRFTLIEGPGGTCAVAQRVGLLARRIVQWAPPGTLVAQGDRIGAICFGSRTDVYLPVDAGEPCVAPGARVRAGLSVLARYTGGGR